MLAAAAAALTGCASEPSPPETTETERRDPVRVEEPALAVGITEPNPAFVWSAEARPELPEPFRRWRDELGEMNPDYYRLVIDWASLQPDPSRPADLDQPQAGCMRATPPCLGWGGLREQLAALASRQQEGGWSGFAVLTGTPDWAAREAHRCDDEEASARSRMPREDALPAYQKLVRDVLAAAEEEGAELRWWSAWNEPNHPTTLSPQHDPCSDRSSTPAVDAYAVLLGSLRDALAAAPGEQRIVLGELAGINRSTRRSTGTADFVAALPREVVCEAEVIGLHAYAGGRDPVDRVRPELARHGCGRDARFWITETGAGSPRRGVARRQKSSNRAGCEEMDAALRRWYRDESVGVAIQYTFREDDLFRVGLASTGLEDAYPTLALWQAWGGERQPGDPPPERTCRG